MLTRQQYKSPPLVEGIIGFGVSGNERENAISKLNKLSESDFNSHTVSEMKAMTVQMGPMGSQTTEAISGYLYHNKNNAENIMMRNDGFSYHKLAPYVSWEESLKATLSAWEIYKTTLPDSIINSYSVRYINVIKIPLPLDDFKKYILTFIDLSPSLNQGLSAFRANFCIPYVEKMANVVINMGLVQSAPEDNDKVSLLFDIDVSGVSASSEEVINVDTLNKLHLLANEIFEGSITDCTRSIFNK